MKKGKSTTDAFSAKLEGKVYKDGINNIIRTSSARPIDFDDKVFNLLDHLEKETEGRAMDACVYMTQALEGLARERVSNWRAYIYTHLKSFDEDAYKKMKADKGDKRTRRTDRVRERLSSSVTPTASSDTRGRGETRFNAEAKEFVPRSSSVPSAVKKFNHGATEFVPGRPWAGGSAPGQEQQHVFNHTAAEYVPGQTWSSASDRNKTLDQSAAEFVPGTGAYMGRNVVPPARQGAAGADAGRAKAATQAVQPPVKPAAKAAPDKASNGDASSKAEVADRGRPKDSDAVVPMAGCGVAGLVLLTTAVIVVSRMRQKS